MRNTTINGLILATMFFGGLNLGAKAADRPISEARLKLRLLAYVPGINSSTDTMKEKLVAIFARIGDSSVLGRMYRNGEATGDSRCAAPLSVNEMYVRIVPGEAGEGRCSRSWHPGLCGASRARW